MSIKHDQGAPKASGDAVIPKNSNSILPNTSSSLKDRSRNLEISDLSLPRASFSGPKHLESESRLQSTLQNPSSKQLSCAQQASQLKRFSDKFESLGLKAANLIS